MRYYESLALYNPATPLRFFLFHFPEIIDIFHQNPCSENKMKLFLVHCGFYDSSLCDGLYESHVNFFVAAENFDEAKLKAREIPEFQSKRMHVDGLQEVVAVNGYQITLSEDPSLKKQTIILSNKHRDLAPKKVTSSEE